jgi:hypothetical protein
VFVHALLCDASFVLTEQFCVTFAFFELLAWYNVLCSATPWLVPTHSCRPTLSHLLNKVSLIVLILRYLCLINRRFESRSEHRVFVVFICHSPRKSVIMTRPRPRYFISLPTNHSNIMLGVTCGGGGRVRRVKCLSSICATEE